MHVYAHTCMHAHTAINKAGLWIMLDVTAEDFCCCCCCTDSGSDLDSADEEAVFQQWAPLSLSDWSWPEGGRVFSPSPFVSSAGSVFCFFSSSVCATQKQPLRKGEKKKKRNLFFWLGVNYFLLIFSQQTNPHMKLQSLILCCFFVFWHYKPFWSSRKVFFHVWILRKAAILHTLAPLDPDALDSLYLQHQNVCIHISSFKNAATGIN